MLDKYIEITKEFSKDKVIELENFIKINESLFEKDFLLFNNAMILLFKWENNLAFIDFDKINKKLEKYISIKKTNLEIAIKNMYFLFDYYLNNYNDEQINIKTNILFYIWVSFSLNWNESSINILLQNLWYKKNDIKTLNYLWIVYFTHKDLDNSSKYFSKVLELDKENLEALLFIWKIFNRQKKYEESITYLLNVIEKDKFFSISLYLNITDSYKNLWKYDLALKYINILLEKYPSIIEAQREKNEIEILIESNK